jgi:TonB family protein
LEPGIVAQRQFATGERKFAMPRGRFGAKGHDTQHLRAEPLPPPGARATDPVSYKSLILSRLQRSKRYPEGARARGARGTAVVAFSLDEKGGVAGARLLRPSGEAELDTESLALIHRAAPFPVPPPGAQRAFAIDIAFGMGS